LVSFGYLFGSGELALSERDNDNEESRGGRPGLPIDPLRVWNILRSRWHLIVIAGVVGAFLGAAIAKKFVGNTYAASGIITWTVNNEEYEADRREAIIESMLIGSNLEQVQQRLKTNIPLNKFVKLLSVSGSQKSSNVAVGGEWDTPDGAAVLVNTVIDVFLEQRHKVVKDGLVKVAERYREAVSEAEKRQKLAAQAYDDFRRESGISDISQERELAITQAAAISAQADDAKMQAEAANRKLSDLKSNPAAAESNAAFTAADREQAASDAKRLPELRGELDRAKIQFSADHPQVRRLEAELDSITARVKARGNNPTVSVATIQNQVKAAESRRRAAEELSTQLQARLNKLSAVEGRAAMLLGEMRVAELALDAAKTLLNQSELAAQNPPSEFRVVERATPPTEALASPRKKIALGFPIGFTLIMGLVVLVWSLRKLDVRTPKEAAFWSNVPVVGASTWPRDPDMLSSLMHDLDDYAPHCEGVTLIVGASLDEAHLARRVAEWDGHRGQKGIDDPQRMLSAGQGASAYPLMKAGTVESVGGGTGNMQILTLTGPVPAQALRRAARLADRVLVVVASGKHSIFQLMKIKGRLGRDSGIGVLLVGLDKEYAMVRDRVGEIERFWYATRAAGS
jgi:uncharacterized protein involved in exopolysaccharide biosynthesis